jgi:hypothetical protein
MPQKSKLESEVSKIKQRNQKVEGDKAWETSLTRRSLIAIFTYLAIALYLNAIRIPHAWLSALIPAIGFLLSTLTLPWLKNLWLRHIYKK